MAALPIHRCSWRGVVFKALQDEFVLRATALTRARWGFDGISVFEAPDGDLAELARRIPAMAERPTVLVAAGADIRHAGFPLLDTAGELHWTIVLADTTSATLGRLREVFSDPLNNPGYRRRTKR